MSEPTNFIAKKMVNALIPTAEARFPMGDPLGLVMKLFKALGGGLWVGGTLYLLPDRLDFQPNALNRSAHKADVSRRVPLANIASVDHHFGGASHRVTVTLQDGTDFKFRCYGAPEFVQRILAQMRND